MRGIRWMFLGCASITGAERSWLVEAHISFASVEATDAALAAAGGPGASTDPAFGTLIGVLRPGLSYRPVDAIKALPLARYFGVTIFRTRPGYSYQFAELIRM